MTALRFLPWLLLFSACQTNPTLQLDIFSDERFSVIDNTETLIVTISGKEYVSQKENGQFNLEFDVDIDTFSGKIMAIAKDVSGNDIAWGQTPSIPGSLDTTLRLYLAPEGSIGTSIESTTATHDIGGSSNRFGATLVGGIDDSDDYLADVLIYNAYTHQMQLGLPLSTPRSKVLVGNVDNRALLLWGGENASGTVDEASWFDLSVEPSGSHIPLNNAGVGDSILQLSANGLVVGSSQSKQVTWPFADVAAYDTALPGVSKSVIEDGTPVALSLGDASEPNQTFNEEWAPLPTQSLPKTNSCITKSTSGWVVFSELSSEVWQLDDSDVSQTALLPTPLDGGECQTVSSEGNVYVTSASGTIIDIIRDFGNGDLDHVARLPLTPPRPGLVLLALPNGQAMVASGGVAEVWLVNPPRPDSE